MRSITITILLSLLALSEQVAAAPRPGAVADPTQSSAKQLLAVRGEITKIKSQGRGMLLVTIRPAKEFAEVTVLARENDFVGSAVGRADDVDLFGLLTDDSRDNETITVAEL